ncbi:MAG: hypothetical protein D6707_07300, partial [Bacteroidetes bacterium]
IKPLRCKGYIYAQNLFAINSKKERHYNNNRVEYVIVFYHLNHSNSRARNNFKLQKTISC